MISIDTRICKPSVVFIVIIIIITLIYLAIDFLTNPVINIGATFSYVCSQLILAFLCMLIIIGICAFSETLAWVAVIILVALSICGLLSTVLAAWNTITNTSMISYQQQF